MGVVDGLSKARMLAIEASCVVGGSISSGHLVLTKQGGGTIDAGNVVGPAASISNGAPAGPIAGQMFFDTANLAGLTDLMASKNPSTSVANWGAYGYGYDPAVGFSTVAGAVRLSWAGSAGNHFAGIALSGLTPGESYLGLLKVRVPALSPDVYFTVGYKTSGHKMSIKDNDVTLLLAFTADATSAVFGVEAQGVTGYCDVKGMSVYVANQRGFPNYIFDGSGWVETMHSAQKGDIYSRVNTFGDQVINGIKQFNGSLWSGSMPSGNPFLIAGSNIEQGILPQAAFSQDNSGGGFVGFVLRGKTDATANTRTVGIIFKHSDESTIAESNKSWELFSWAPGANSSNRAFILKNGGTGINSIYVDSNNDYVTFNGFVAQIGRGGTTADSATLILSGADAGAGGGGGEIRWLKNNSLKWSLYTLGSADGNLYVRDQANAKMVATFTPGGAGASKLAVTDLLTTDRLIFTKASDISGTDLNSLTTAGQYNGSAMTNAPDANWWYIEVLMHSNFAGATPTYTVQRATSLTNGTPIVYQRAQLGAGTWSAWYRIDYATTPWTGVTFENSWANYGAPFQAAQYRKVGDEVQLRGLIRNGTNNVSMFTLPAGFRPPADMLFTGIQNAPGTWASGAASAGTAHTHSQAQPTALGLRIDVLATGVVKHYSSQGTAYLDLSQIRFSTI